MPISEGEATSLLDAGERMYAPIEVAHILDLTQPTIQSMCRDGRIKAVKHGTMWRIPKSEVARYIQHGPRSAEEIEKDGK